MKDLDPIFLKPYNPKETEGRIYSFWEKDGFFNPDVSVEKGYTKKDAEPYSISLPPPNVTGTLHMGHASMLAIEDILIRFNRMSGKKTLWLPGTDHAAIATQSKVEKILQKEGVRKNDLGREAFLERVNAFAKESHDTITNQIRRMGSSVDWSREAYTLDEKREFAVRTAFKKMYDDGLIYRKYRIVNWDPKGQTTISDDEIVYTPIKGKLYTFKYSKDFPIPIATTRPETKLGDTGVAVHPEDTRYKQYIGKTFEVNFIGVNLSIKIVGDSTIDKDFGTGAVGITPAHSMVDAEIADRHNLPTKQVINEFAKITIPDESHPLNGKKILEAREEIIRKLTEDGLLIKEEEIEQNLATAERTGGTVEPLPKLQWFIDVNKEFVLENSNIKGIESGSKTTLKEIMRKAVENNQITILPDRFEKIYFNWIDNLRDWCISRQIWFGHRIPVWYRKEEIHVGTTAPKGDGWEQDSDTLDTWFSSGLWTFSTLGWPEQTDDFKTYHPTNVLETGYDIIFFWVARMILMSGYILGDVPFKTVYLHGLVRDTQGRKMSKSLGNIMDPVDMIEKYGADAVRMSLIIGTGPGNDSRISEDKIKAYKLFSNKLWNISRFIFENTKDISEKPTLTPKDAETLEEFTNFSKDITKDIENYRFYLAGEKLYHYVWHTIADVVIEENKDILKNQSGAENDSASWTLQYLLKNSLIMLHPFIPFVTEEIWQKGKLGDKPLAVETWPS